MKLKFPIILLLWLLPIITLAENNLTHESIIELYYEDTIREIQNHGFKGPIAAELAQFAMLRRIYEDGTNRPSSVSMNGMVPGQPNKDIIERLYMPECEVDVVRARDGQGCYRIQCSKANIMGSVAIALWYDKLIYELSCFSEKDKEIWDRSVRYSGLIETPFGTSEHQVEFNLLKQKRIKLLERINSKYGPNGRGIAAQREKFKYIFNSVIYYD